MKPLWVKQIDGEEDEGDGAAETGHPLDPNSGGTPGTPKQAPDAD